MPYQWSELLDSMLPLPEPSTNGKSHASTAHLAGSRFNELVPFGKVLEAFGHCSFVRAVGIEEHWHYRNSENDVSATHYLDDDHVTIWSETMARELGLEVRRPYDKFGFWGAVKHGGNYSLAHDELVTLGIGDNIFRPSPLPNGNAAPEVIPSGLIIVTASEVMPVRAQWLWPGWAPRGKLLDFAADPGTGKSTVTNDLGARATNGEPMPGEDAPTFPASSVLYLSGEDDLNDTTIWRLKAAGANLNRIYHIQAAITEDGPEPVVIPRDVGLIEDAVLKTRSAIVVIDVLNEYLDGNVDNYRDTQIRRALARLRDMAQRTNATVVMLRHLRKEGGKAIYRGSGSIGIVGAARAAWTVGRHPEDASLRALAVTKMNLAIEPIPLAFKLMPVEDMDVARVDWRGPVEGLNADQLLADRAPEDPEEKEHKTSQLDLATNAIREVLRDGPIWSNDLLDAVVNKGRLVSVRTYDRARAKLNVQTKRERMPSGEMGWKVSLPESEDD